jgi:3-keto-5-aminohexanoate cleavage enzyme
MNPSYLTADLIINFTPTGMSPILSHAGMRLRDMPSDCLWNFGGVGPDQLAANTIAIAMGGGVRVGLEDNIYWNSQRKQTATNSMLLERTHEIAAQFSRTVMPPSELRKRLGLNLGIGAYCRGGEVSAQTDQAALVYV